MKSLFLFLAFCVVAYGSDHIMGRGLLDGDAEYCPNYEGPQHGQKDLQFEVTHLSPMPLEDQKAKYEGLLDRPLGTLFGRAIVKLSHKTSLEIKSSFFKVTNLPGDIFGLHVSDDKCEVTLDFSVFTSCDDKCVPMGACVELDRDVIASETGYDDLPFRKGCRALLPEDRAHCLDVDVVALGMGVDEEKGMPYTDENKAELMIMFSHPLNEFVDFKPEDFIVRGSDGAVLEDCKAAMPGDSKNIAYKLSVKHGEPNGHDEMIEICFDGSKTIHKAGMPFPMEKEMCAYYMKSPKKPSEVKSSMMIRKSHAPTTFC